MISNDFLWEARVSNAVPCLAASLVSPQVKPDFAASVVLSVQKRTGRTLSMAAKPFILTIDNVRPVCCSGAFLKYRKLLKMDLAVMPCLSAWKAKIGELEAADIARCRGDQFSACMRARKSSSR